MDNGMMIEVGKVVDPAWLAHAGVAGTGVPANAVIDAGNNVNLAILAMVNGESFTLTVKPVVTLVNYPQGSNKYFPTIKFVAPAGAKIGNVFIAKKDKVFELEHYRVKGGKEARPSALREEEIVKGALKVLNEKLFPPSDLTGKPIPPTDYCSRLVAEFGWDAPKLEHAAEMINKFGMSWRAYYLAEKAKAK